jgi:hypothetical protein
MGQWSGQQLGGQRCQGESPHKSRTKPARPVCDTASTAAGKNCDCQGHQHGEDPPRDDGQPDAHRRGPQQVIDTGRLPPSCGHVPPAHHSHTGETEEGPQQEDGYGHHSVCAEDLCGANRHDHPFFLM